MSDTRYRLNQPEGTEIKITIKITIKNGRS